MMRLQAAALLCLALGGCGFRPLYAVPAEGSEQQAILKTIAVEAVTGPRAPQATRIMAKELPERFADPGSDARYTMQVRLNERNQGVSVTIDSNTRRFNYSLSGQIRYTDRKSNEVRVQNLRSIVSYAVVPSQYATLVGREDAIRRAVLDLSRKIEVDAILYANGGAAETSDGGLLDTPTDQDPLRTLERDAEADRRRQEDAPVLIGDPQ
jgi:hypothetical protein